MNEILTLEEVLEAARRLPESDRRQLVVELEASTIEVRSEERRLEAMKRWLEHGGTGHSAFTDVSIDKNKHLADIAASKP